VNQKKIYNEEKCEDLQFDIAESNSPIWLAM